VSLYLAQGVVYKARDPRTGETVTGNGDTFDKMFRREVRYLEACRSHPCLVDLRAAHHFAAGAFLVMEYAG
jgi:cell division cycle 2-like